MDSVLYIREEEVRNPLFDSDSPTPVVAFLSVTSKVAASASESYMKGVKTKKQYKSNTKAELNFFLKRRFFNARSKNISLRRTGTKYSMVRVFSRSIDRD
ncbi:hypothetical protein RJ640_014162 [Escallonia rubra]|uniref:Uncharacterized protein n=1 Tax=Escallonia rubra TaxID=112253 RepID=A0AA88RSX3_9ASTE|nr:hypothetical protein RJ640_014162 [Escallonia rubra]